jgi:NitT/TauT family transport system substrate-binding protein
MTPRSFIARLVLVAVALNALNGCSSPNATTSPVSSGATVINSTDKKPLKDVKVQLGFLLQSTYAPLIVAINKGYFAEEGLNVKWERGFGNVDTISRLASGQFDISFSDMYNALEFNDKNPNERLIAIAVPFNKSEAAILTLKEKGINDPKGLAGKKLGAPAGDGPRKLWPLLAKQIGVDANSVEWLSMEPKLRETFLLQGQVDGITGFSTSALPSLLKGGKKQDDINVFYYTSYGLDFYGNALLTKPNYAKENPEAVKGFVKAYLRGMQDMLKDPASALDAVIAADASKLMNRDAETLRLQIALDKLLVTPEVESVGLGDLDPKRLQTTINQTVAGFGLKGAPKVTDIFDNRFLPPKESRLAPPAAERKSL